MKPRDLFIFAALFVLVPALWVWDRTVKLRSWLGGYNR